MVANEYDMFGGRRDGREDVLTTSEFKLLTILLERPRIVMSREQLFDFLCDPVHHGAIRSPFCVIVCLDLCCRCFCSHSVWSPVVFDAQSSTRI